MQAGHTPDTCLGGDKSPLCAYPQSVTCNRDILGKLCDGRPECFVWNRMQLKWNDGENVKDVGGEVTQKEVDAAKELKE